MSNICCSCRILTKFGKCRQILVEITNVDCHEDLVKVTLYVGIHIKCLLLLSDCRGTRKILNKYLDDRILERKSYIEADVFAHS
jgi:hypothetical protein